MFIGHVPRKSLVTDGDWFQKTCTSPLWQDSDPTMWNKSSTKIYSERVKEVVFVYSNIILGWEQNNNYGQPQLHPTKSIEISLKVCIVFISALTILPSPPIYSNPFKTLPKFVKTFFFYKSAVMDDDAVTDK